MTFHSANLLDNRVLANCAKVSCISFDNSVLKLTTIYIIEIVSSSQRGFALSNLRLGTILGAKNMLLKIIKFIKPTFKNAHQKIKHRL